MQQFAISLGDFQAQFSPVVTPDDVKKAEDVQTNTFGDVNYKSLVDTPVKYSDDAILRIKDIVDPIKQEVRQICLAKDVLHNNDNIGDIKYTFWLKEEESGCIAIRQQVSLIVKGLSIQ